MKPTQIASNEARGRDPVNDRRPYEPPRLVTLGSVSELTMNSGGSVADAGPFGKKGT